MNRPLSMTPCTSAPRMFGAMLAVAAAALLSAPRVEAAIIPAGQSVSLANLIAGDTIVVGDKVFSGFSYAPSGDMPAAAAVQVIGKILGNSVELLFSGAFHDLPGGSASNAGLGFNVTVTDPLMFITNVRLAGTLHTLGSDAQVAIKEGFSGLPPAIDPNFPDMYIMRHIVGGVPSPFNQTEDSVDFQQSHGVPGFQSLRVLKDIFADAGSATFNQASVTTFTQTFDQIEIPEPATMALAGLSGIALVVVARRRR